MNPCTREATPAAPEYPVDALGPILGDPAAALHHEMCPIPNAGLLQLCASQRRLAVQGHANVELPTGSRQSRIESMFFVLETGGARVQRDEHALGEVYGTTRLRPSRAL